MRSKKENPNEEDPYTESQIIKVLNEVEGGRAVKYVCSEHGISDATYYNWKSKYDGMTASDIKKLTEIEDESRRLKRMYADLSLQHEALKDIVEKKLWGQPRNASWSIMLVRIMG
jgi:putative transposase